MCKAARLLLLTLFISTHWCRLVAAEEIFKVREGNLDLALSRQEAQYVLELKTSSTTAAPGKAESNVVESPKRLVVDLYGISVPKNFTYLVKDDAAVSQIRLGTHADKLRIVVDLSVQTAQVTNEELSKSGYRLSFTVAGGVLASSHATSPAAAPTSAPSPALGAPKLIAVNTKAVPTPTSMPSPSPAASATPTLAIPTLIASAPPATEVLPSATPPAPPPTVVPSYTAKPVSSSALLTDGAYVLKQIGFDHVGLNKAPVIRFSLSKPSGYNLIKTDERRYELVFPSSKLESQALALPQFPPHDFIGFTLVQAREEGGAVHVSIGVENGIRISPVTKGNLVLVGMLNK